MPLLGNAPGTLDYRSATSLLNALGPSHIGIAILDRRLWIQAINRSLARSNGLPLAAQLGKPAHEVVGDAAIQVIGPCLERVFSTRQPVYGLELSAKLPGRKSTGHWVLDYLPVTNDKGAVSHICAVILEVTWERMLERWFEGSQEGIRKPVRILTKARKFHRCCSWSVPGWGADGPLHPDRINGEQKTHGREQGTHGGERGTHGWPDAAEMRHAAGRCPDSGSIIAHAGEGSGRRISAREGEVLRLLAAGQSNKQVASVLEISIRTVETHRARIFHKLHVGSVVGLVHYAIRHHIVEA